MCIHYSGKFGWQQWAWYEFAAELAVPLSAAQLNIHAALSMLALPSLSSKQDMLVQECTHH